MNQLGNSQRKKKFSERVYILFSKLIKNHDRQAVIENHHNNIIFEQIDPIAIYFSIPIAVKLSNIDSQINQNEKAAIINYFGELGVESSKIQSMIIDLSKTDFNFEIYVNKLKLLIKNSQNQFFYQLIQILIKVAIADGPLLSIESAFIKKTSSLLNIRSEILDKMISSQLSNTPEKSPYLELGVDKNISKEALKNRYRSLAKQFHPDNFSEDSTISEEYKKMMQEKFHSINKAYNTIKDSL